MERIVYLERESIIADVRRPACDHDWIEHARTLQAEVEARLTGATIAIVNKLVLDAATIARLPMLKMIAVAATGTNNVDLDACRARGIVVSNVRGYAVHTVPEHAIALMFALARQIPEANTLTQAGKWPKNDFMGVELTSKTLGLIGCGNIGSIVAERALGLRMKVIAFDPFLTPERSTITPDERASSNSSFANSGLPRVRRKS